MLAGVVSAQNHHYTITANTAFGGANRCSIVKQETSTMVVSFALAGASSHAVTVVRGNVGAVRLGVKEAFVLDLIGRVWWIDLTVRPWTATVPVVMIGASLSWPTLNHLELTPNERWLVALDQVRGRVIAWDLLSAATPTAVVPQSLVLPSGASTDAGLLAAAPDNDTVFVGDGRPGTATPPYILDYSLSANGFFNSRQFDPNFGFFPTFGPSEWDWDPTIGPGVCYVGCIMNTATTRSVGVCMIVPGLANALYLPRIIVPLASPLPTWREVDVDPISGWVAFGSNTTVVLGPQVFDPVNLLWYNSGLTTPGDHVSVRWAPFDILSLVIFQGIEKWSTGLRVDLLAERRLRAHRNLPGNWSYARYQGAVPTTGWVANYWPLTTAIITLGMTHVEDLATFEALP
jgi:hypothetical protein